MRLTLLASGLGLLLLGEACTSVETISDGGNPADSGLPPDAGPDAGVEAVSDAGPDAGGCAEGQVLNFPFTTPDQISFIPSGTTISQGWHVPVGTTVTYDTQPPVGGYHYQIWAIWGTHTDAVPVSYLVHNMEHGGILLLYNCPSGCPDLVSQLQALLDSQPQDPVCSPETPPVRARFVMAPDPDLDVPFAAASWGWSYKQSDACVNTAALQSFITAHYEHGRPGEDLCVQGGYQ